jgi:hypothetical protein
MSTIKLAGTRTPHYRPMMMLRSLAFGALGAFAAAMPLGAQTFSDYEIYSPDPAESGDVVGTPFIDGNGSRFFVLRDPFTGHNTHYSISPVQGNWTAFGTDGLVAGGNVNRLKAGEAPPSTQVCVGPIAVACGVAAGVAIRELVCEIRTNSRVHRARQACAAAGHGTEITQQSRCGNVMTRCIIARPRHALQ